MHLHSREDLFTHESGPDFVEWSAIDEPREVDADWVSLVSWGIFGHVVGQEVIIVNFGGEVFGLLLSLTPFKMVIVVL